MQCTGVQLIVQESGCAPPPLLSPPTLTPPSSAVQRSQPTSLAPPPGVTEAHNTNAHQIQVPVLAQLCIPVDAPQQVPHGQGTHAWHRPACHHAGRRGTAAPWAGPLEWLRGWHRKGT